MKQKRHVRGSLSSVTYLPGRRPGSSGKIVVLHGICPFTLEPRIKCFSPKAAVKRVCAFTLEDRCQ